MLAGWVVEVSDPGEPWWSPELRTLVQTLASGSVQTFLDAVVAEAARGGACGLTLHTDPQGEFLGASSDAVAGELEELQRAERVGPCVYAVHSGRTVEVADTSAEERWPAFCERARQLRVRGVLSIPLQSSSDTVGALTMYLRTPISDAERGRVERFAEQIGPLAGVAVRLAPLERAEADPGGTGEIARLREQATHDELTGLLNRRGISAVLDDLVHDGVRERVAVLFCDLDNFKRINDGLGHEAGDELLRELAQRLVRGLPHGCTPARLSGDEFVIICADVPTIGTLEELAEKVSELLQATVPLQQGSVVEVSASVGATLVTGPDVTTGDLFRYADAAMFEAKASGPASTSVAHPALITTVNRQMSLETELRRALEEDELVLHYQPIVDRAGAVVMAEALVRWPHGEYGMLPPGAILQAARRGNLSERLDEYVLRTAVREAAAWSSQQSEPPAVAINLMSLPDGTRFSDRLTAAVEDAGLHWSRLVLEITETPLADLTEAGRAAMAGLAGRGVRFALDDFGTGYSSMSRLEQLPLHIIKVDRSFVVDLPTNSAHRAITAAVMAMASSMGYTCVAEGVETSAQLSALANLGYVTYQGWLFCPAVPPHEFRTVLATSPLPMP